MNFHRIELGASAVQFPSIPCRAAVLQAKANNSGIVSFGSKSLQCMELDAGDSIMIYPSTGNLNEIYALSSSAGDFINVIAYRDSPI